LGSILDLIYSNDSIVETNEQPCSDGIPLQRGHLVELSVLDFLLLVLLVNSNLASFSGFFGLIFDLSKEGDFFVLVVPKLNT